MSADPLRPVTRTHHVGLNVRGAILWPDKLLKSALIGPDGKHLSADAARAALMDTLASGVEMLPCVPCDDFDPKTGCRGHADYVALPPGGTP